MNKTTNLPKNRGPALDRSKVTVRSAELELSIIEREGNTMVLATIASVIIATLISVKFLTPLLHTAAVAPFFLSAMKRHRHRWSLLLAFRWAIALFVSLVAVGVFLPDRVVSSIPLANSALQITQQWVQQSDASPPADYLYLLVGAILFVAASVVSGGLFGFMVGSIGIGGAASAALLLYRNGINVLQVSLVAVPIWQICLFAAAAFLIVPAGIPAVNRFMRKDGATDDHGTLRQLVYWGAGFFAASLLLRLVFEGVWRTITQHWTVL